MTQAQGLPAARRIPVYGFAGRLLSDAECDRAIAQGRALMAASGTVDGPAEVNRSLRDSEIAFLPIDAGTRWLYERVYQGAMRANHEAWGFSLTRSEQIQFTSYEAPGQHYSEHIDLGMSPPFSLRKLSVVVQLTDPAEYEGGDLVILTGGGRRQAAPRGRGELILFPSYVMHQVEPVRRGRRHSLVNWLLGDEPFR